MPHARNESPSQEMKKAIDKTSLSAAALSFVALFLITLSVVQTERQMEDRTAALDFSSRASLKANAVEEGIRDSLAEVSSVNSFLNAAGDVTEAQFASFTRQLLKAKPQIFAISFQCVLTDRDRAQFEATLQQRKKGSQIFEWANGVRIRAPRKNVYRVVDFVEEHDRSGASVGLDATSIPVQEAAVARAKADGLAISTSLFTLLRDGAKGALPLPASASAPFASRRGFALMMPLFAGPASAVTGTQASAQPRGYAVVLFRTGETIEHILKLHGAIGPGELSVQVFGPRDDGNNELVFQTGFTQADAAAVSPLLAWRSDRGPRMMKHDFEVAGRAWQVKVQTQPGAAQGSMHQSLIIFLTGLVASILVSMFSFVLVSRSTQVRRLVELRTAELGVANGLLTTELAERERLLEALHLRNHAIEASPNAVIITSAEGPIFPVEYVNPAFEKSTGYSLAEVVGLNCNFLQGEDTEQPAIEEIRLALRERRACRVTVRNYRKDGTLFWNDLHVTPVADASGEIRHFVASQYDVSAMKAYEAELHAHVNTDALTGLSNRNLLRDRLSQAISVAGRFGQRVWVVFLDLDRFRLVNDSLGHQAGNAVLVQTAARLSDVLRETDTIARLSGDKFVVVLDERDVASPPVIVIQRILETIRAAFQVQSQEVFLTASLGIAIFPEDTADVDRLVEHAEKAVYRAKEKGGDGFQFYAPQLTAFALERLEVESDLRRAIEHGEFLLHYQPQVDVKSGRARGVEALIRWQHPSKGMIAPDRFISIAEGCGLISPIGEWVLRTACQQVKRWHQAGLADMCIAVNLSARQFMQDDLVQIVAGVLAETGLDPRFLELELTESMVMTDVAKATATLHELKRLGVRLAIDDFGTGYSSLAYLRRFPIDVLKIDRSFVQDIADDSDSAAIALLVISLAHSLRLDVVAEGVETEQQLNFLVDGQCDQIQGYYFSKPLPAGPALTVLLGKDFKTSSRD
jgi:diguanylate cyclase (GGDEF)-like protein/PAS domain S-box-containing protein